MAAASRDYAASEAAPSNATGLLSRLRKRLARHATEEANKYPKYREIPFKQTRFIWAAATGVTLLVLAVGAALLFDRDTPDTPAQREANARLAMPGNHANAQVASNSNEAATVDAASSSLAQGNLDVARTHIATLASSNPAAQRLNDRLTRQLQARDAALNAARACQQSGDTPCLLKAASNALADDATSTEARALLLSALSVKENRPAVAATDHHHSPPEHHRHAKRHLARYSRTTEADDVYGRH